MRGRRRNRLAPAVPAAPAARSSETAGERFHYDPLASFSVAYSGTLLAERHRITLHLGARRRAGIAVTVYGGIVQQKPDHRVHRFLPVTLELPDIVAARVAVPPPFSGFLRVRLESDGATVHGVGELGLDLKGFHFDLLSFSAVIGLAR